MNALEKLSGVIVEIADDVLVLNDTVTVVVDLLKTLHGKYNDADLAEAIDKLSGVDKSIEDAAGKLKDAADSVASSGGDATPTV